MNHKADSTTLWLYLCCGMIFVMALLGAITRLTESGLSITSWDPVLGALPPMSEEAWNKAFAAYQNIPQYQVFNRGMSLDAFKHIYFWEWLHRLWGRLIGLVFALPLLWFYAAKKIARAEFVRLASIFALGGLQGFIGWFMVQSGLEVRTTVSPYRLALHLGFALLLYSLLLWVALGRSSGHTGNKVPLPFLGEGLGVGQDVSHPSCNKKLFDRRQTPCPPLPPPASGRGIFLHGWLALLMLAITIIWGALVAGLRAGQAYNTWPLMDGAFLPDAAFSLQPAWLNLFANTALVQFMHRWLGPATFLVIVLWLARCWHIADERQKKRLAALGLMAMLQVGLGIGTLLSHVEIAIAVVHQAGAITLLTLLLINLRRLYDNRTSRK